VRSWFFNGEVKIRQKYSKSLSKLEVSHLATNGIRHFCIEFIKCRWKYFQERVEKEKERKRGEY
jgi:hypothetical protein